MQNIFRHFENQSKSEMEQSNDIDHQMRRYRLLLHYNLLSNNIHWIFRESFIIPSKNIGHKSPALAAVFYGHRRYPNVVLLKID